jgi:aryl-alcohol dehydrogenase-like predicted oxidoreductase
MEYRRLGNSGLEVSVVGLGTNNFGRRLDYAGAEAVVKKAIDLGVTLIDTADVYGGGESEEFLGQILKPVRRDVIIATKFSSPMGEGPLWKGTSRRYIYDSVYASLKRLQTDYIDLFQIHQPDANTPIDETLRALDDLVRKGLVCYIGCSNFTAWMVVEAQMTARMNHYSPVISAQNEYNLLNRKIESELLPMCQKYGLGQLPYYPLAAGFLSGKYRPGGPVDVGRLADGGGVADRTLTDRNYEVLQKLEAFAQARGHSVLDLAWGWLISQPVISSVIAGSMTPEQVESNVKAAEWHLTPEEMAEVDALAR